MNLNTIKRKLEELEAAAGAFNNDAWNWMAAALDWLEDRRTVAMHQRPARPVHQSPAVWLKFDGRIRGIDELADRINALATRRESVA